MVVYVMTQLLVVLFFVIMVNKMDDVVSVLLTLN